jgi:hypothetical protein
MHTIERIRRVVGYACAERRFPKSRPNVGAIAWRGKRTGKRRVPASAVIAVATSIACAGLPSAPALAQRFPMFGKGVDVLGLVDTITYEGPRGRTIYTEAINIHDRVQASVLVVDGGRQCFVNGAPTNVGLVFVRQGAYARSFTCDPERKGTASHGAEVTTSQSLRSTASVTGNVVTLNFSMTFASKGWENSPTGRLEGVSRIDVKGIVRLRFDGQTCTVLAVSREQVMVNDLRTASGAPYRETEARHRAVSPVTTCRLTD